MIEDFNRLIELLLPTYLRQNKLIALLRALIAMPMQRRFSDFNLLRAKSDYEATVTPQVCSLTDAVQRTFDCVCEITELNGKPYDFLVSIDRSTDLQAIKEFIDAHKLAGKSFVFELGDVVFTATWMNYTNENLIEVYSAEWSFYVDEDDGTNHITIYLLQDINDVWRVRAEAEKPVASDLYIAVSIVYRVPPSGELHHGGDASISLPAGTTMNELTVSLAYEPGAVISFTTFVFPNKDEVYTYTTNSGETWH